MTSQARIDANRRNARKSTGPRTPAGKTAVHLNALWHGAFATDLLLPGEDAAAFSQLRDEFRSLYQPASQAEEFLVSRMVLASWRLQRLAAMESRVLRAHAGLHSSDSDLVRTVKTAILGAGPEPESSPEDSAPSDPLALAWIRDSNGGNALAKLARYQTALERSFYRALHELQLLRPKPEAP
jgi:hypothetical protein